jgi:hypothetical protein
MRHASCPTAFVGRETKLSANCIKGAEHSLKVTKLEGTGTWAGFGRSRPEATGNAAKARKGALLR